MTGQVLDGTLAGAVLPDAVVRALAQQLNAGELRQIQPDDVNARSANAWLRGAGIFVKLYARPEHAAAERAVAAALGGLLDGGELPGAGQYAVFAWQDLVPPPWTTETAARAASLLNTVHATDPPAGLRRREASEDVFGALLERFAREAPDVHAEHQANLTGTTTRDVVRAAARVETPDVLLHGDFSLRNIGVRRDGGYALFDFERACTGFAEFDLERIWDRELASIDGGRTEFVDALDVRPDEALLNYARLVCALTTVMGARRTRDENFEREGRARLEALC